MKTVHIILGVLILLLFMVGSASANPFDLTTSNDASNGHIWVHVDYDKANGILTYTDKSSTLLTGTQTLTSGSGILSIAIANIISSTSVLYITGTKEGGTYVLYSNDPNHPVTIDDNHDWKYNGGSQGFASFGDFDTTFGDNSKYDYSKVVVYFATPGPVLEATSDSKGHIFALHYRLGIMDGSTVVFKENTFKATDGPEPPTPLLSLVKEVSSDDNSWSDSITVPAGSQVYYRFTIKNTGTVTLANPTIVDPSLDFSGVTFPQKLDAGESFTCEAKPITAIVGEHINTATASATYGGTKYDSAPASAKYVGTSSTQVPEFPTMALPVAAVIGLLFIMGRKRKE